MLLCAAFKPVSAAVWTLCNVRYIMSTKKPACVRPIRSGIANAQTENSMRLPPWRPPSTAFGNVATRRRQCAISRHQWGSPRRASTTPSATSKRSLPAPWNDILIARHVTGCAATKRRCLPKRRSFSSLLRSSTTRSMIESAKGASSSIPRLRSRRIKVSWAP